MSQKEHTGAYLKVDLFAAIFLEFIFGVLKVQECSIMGTFYRHDPLRSAQETHSRESRSRIVIVPVTIYVLTLLDTALVSSIMNNTILAVAEHLVGDFLATTFFS